MTFGRPVKEPSEKLEALVSYRITNSEYDEFCLAASKAGLSLNKYIRAMTRKGHALFVVSKVGKASVA